MKYLKLSLLLTLLANYCFLQAQDTLHAADKERRKVSFITTIDIKNATKDGIYLNGYVVNIPYEKLTELNGRKVRISGKVTIVKGLMDNNDKEVKQGRENDTMHILKPKIKVLSTGESLLRKGSGRKQESS